MGQASDLSLARMLDAFNSKADLQAYVQETEGLPDLCVAKAADEARTDPRVKFAPTPKEIRQTAIAIKSMTDRKPVKHSPVPDARKDELRAIGRAHIDQCLAAGLTMAQIGSSFRSQE